VQRTVACDAESSQAGAEGFADDQGRSIGRDDAPVRKQQTVGNDT